MKYNKKYAVGLFSIGILIMVAIMAPNLLFLVQDMYRMGRTWQAERRGLDMAALNQSYDTLRNRMVRFADGVANNKEYFVTGTDYQVESEHFDILDRAISQEYFSIMADMGIIMNALPEFYEEIGCVIYECKKYVVYDAEFDEGIGNIEFLLWYMEVEVGLNYHIRILFDAETYTVYYMEYVEDDGTTAMLERGLDYVYFSSKGQYYDSDWMQEMVQYLIQYCYYYYEAGNEKSQSFVEYMESVEQQKEENKNINAIAVTDSTNIIMNIGARKSYSTLPFGEDNLTWEMVLELTKDDELKCSFGICELKELFPEFTS